MATLQFTEGSNAPPLAVPGKRQLLPNIADGMARVRPEAVYALIPKSLSSYDSGYRTVSYNQFANAVNGIAWLLTQQLGPGKDSEALAYVGPNDISYCVVLLGAVKAGYTMLSLSPRNAESHHAGLFEATNCKTLLTLPPPYSQTVSSIFEGLGAQRPRVIHVPTIFELIDQDYDHFPYPKAFADAKDEKLVIVHTSGSTAAPKAVTYTHEFAASYEHLLHVSPPQGHAMAQSAFNSVRTFTTFPFFHAGGLVVGLFEPLFNQTILVTPLAGVPPSPSGIIEALKHVEVDAVHFAAPFAELIAKDPSMLSYVASKSKFVTYGGGDISDAAGNAWAAKTHLATFNGSTETAPYPLLRPAKLPSREERLASLETRDWKYIHPHSSAGLTFEPVTSSSEKEEEEEEEEEEPLYEAVIHKNPSPSLIQPIFTLFPHISTYRTKDLFSSHPTKPNHYLYRGRTDDLLISATGETCNPLPFEQALTTHPSISAALMVGTGRYRKALLVEPSAGVLNTINTTTTTTAPHKDDGSRLIEEIWPAVEAANATYPEVSRIAKTHVLLTDVDRPFPRAGKGTVQRAASMKLYEKRLSEFYEEMKDGVGSDGAPYQIHLESR